MIGQIRNLDMHLLLVFRSISDTRSVTKTAENMRLSQGAISHSLRKLRTLFDDPLFVRTQSGLVRTQKAEDIGAIVEEIVDLGQNLLGHHGGFDPPSAERLINICASDVGEVAILPRLLERVAREAPNCRVNVVKLGQQRLPELVDTAQIDLLITSVRPRMAGLKQQKLYRHGYAVLASAKSELPDTIDLDCYCSQTHLSASITSTANTVIDQWLKEKGRSRRVVLTTPHVLVLPYLLERNPSYIATVPNFLVDSLAEKGAFRRIDISGEFPSIDVFQYWPERFHHNRFNRWLREVVRGGFMHHVEYDT